MAVVAVSSAVQTLGNLLIEKASFLQDVGEQIQRLKDELKRMRCFLKDANEKQANNESVRNWISEIREVAHDAEDAIEIFILSDESRGLLGRFASFPKHVYHLNKVGKEIERIRKRLQDIERSRLTYGIQDLGDGGVDSSRRRLENVERRRRLAPWEKERDVVGLEEDVKLMLQNAILDERKLGLSISAIVGMGGIGKSTLARMIYNHTAVVARFERRAWVVVSSEFSAEETIKQILLELQNSEEGKKKVLKDTKELEESTKDKQFFIEKLQQMLHKQLVGKRYFVILDDVWEGTHWEFLRSAFPDEQDKASRLLVTSRIRIITKYARYVHEMNLLDPSNSWELFLRKAFIDNSNNRCPKELEYIGRKILEKCQGLPLAISIVGGLLSEQKPSKSGWEMVLKGINSYLGRDQSSVSTILELSYQNLPPQLKSCFLFLAFFKEDNIILAKKLVQMWIAHDLVPLEIGGEEMMEDVARGYLDELINRNLVQVKDTTIDGQVKKCQIHDLLRELSIKKAREEINFEILREEGSSQSSPKPRHRAMYCSRGRFIDSTNQDKHLRSLFVHGIVYVSPPSSYWKSFELLRVLDLESCEFTKLPEAIGELGGLRYLSLRITKIKKLPHSFGKLENLLVLNLRGTFVRMPDFIWKMKSLRHLKLSETPPKVHVNISTLRNLQTLGYIVLRDSYIKQLSQLTSLRELGIYMDDHKISDVSKLFASLAMLENLVCLKLKGCRSLDMNGLGRLTRITRIKLVEKVTRLPSAINFPPNLSHLTLIYTFLEEDPMPVLGKLPKLLYLKLHGAYDGQVMVISHDEFPRLRRLYLEGFWNLHSIKVGEGAMPELQRWEIKHCRYLKIENPPQHVKSAITHVK